MAKRKLSKTRRPSDPLEPMDQEQVYILIRQAMGVAMLINGDASDHPAVPAAGAIAESLHKAMRIMEAGSEEGARHG